MWVFGRQRDDDSLPQSPQTACVWPTTLPAPQAAPVSTEPVCQERTWFVWGMSWEPVKVGDTSVCQGAGGL